MASISNCYYYLNRSYTDYVSDSCHLASPFRDNLTFLKAIKGLECSNNKTQVKDLNPATFCFENFMNWLNDDVYSYTISHFI